MRVGRRIGLGTSHPAVAVGRIFTSGFTVEDGAEHWRGSMDPEWAESLPTCERNGRGETNWEQ